MRTRRTGASHMLGAAAVIGLFSGFAASASSDGSATEPLIRISQNSIDADEAVCDRLVVLSQKVTGECI